MLVRAGSRKRETDMHTHTRLGDVQFQESTRWEVPWELTSGSNQLLWGWGSGEICSPTTPPPFALLSFEAILSHGISNGLQKLESSFEIWSLYFAK